jgi:pimeloyl-ACP methyl ester carboxylesterase
VIGKLAAALPAARVHTFAGAGHIPHSTHPDAYVRTTIEFVTQTSA